MSSAGNNTFLQLTMVNSCPLPLILIDHTLNTPLKLAPLTGQKPEIFYPGDSFSFLWQHSKEKHGWQEEKRISKITEEKETTCSKMVLEIIRLCLFKHQTLLLQCHQSDVLTLDFVASMLSV